MYTRCWEHTHLTSALCAVVHGPLISVLVNDPVVDTDTAVNVDAAFDQLVLIRLGLHANSYINIMLGLNNSLFKTMCWSWIHFCSSKPGLSWVSSAEQVACVLQHRQTRQSGGFLPAGGVHWTALWPQHQGPLAPWTCWPGRRRRSHRPSAGLHQGKYRGKGV